MGSQVVGDNNNENYSEFQPLARQNSMYNLTLDEVQSLLGDLGKPISSMNLDELLKNVWTVEANQSNQSIRMENENSAEAGQVVLQTQPNLSLTNALSKKTVDEVWRDIQQGKDKKEPKSQERQFTLGEMTLEDFFVAAGVFSVGSSNRKNTNGPNIGVVDPDAALQQFVPYGPWLQYAQPHYQHPQQNMMAAYGPSQMITQPMHIAAGGPLDVTYADAQMALSSPMIGNLSDSMKSARKRGPEDMAEMTVERKQKRMIKNRESAARSRARKQAYTTELEIKVSRLEEENEKLRKEKEFDNMVANIPPPEPKCQLRRVSSASF